MTDQQVRDWYVGARAAAAVCLVIVTTACGGAWWLGGWMAKMEAKLAAYDTRVTERREARDAERDAMLARMDSLEGRIRPLEMTTASTAQSLAFIRDQQSAAFDDLRARLDRIEQQE